MNGFSISKAFSVSNGTEAGPDHRLRPILHGSVSPRNWEGAVRPEIVARWVALLGGASFSRDGYDPAPRVVETMEGPDFRAVSHLQPTGPGQFQKVITLHPARPAGNPAPCAVVPFYHPEKSAGLAAGSATPGGAGLRLEEDGSAETEVRQIGRHLARLGFTVACVEAFPFNTVPDPGGEAPFAWWHSAATKLAADHPAWTGLGKLVHDTSRAVDLLLDQPGTDPSRVLAMGHSLGGKMAFYAGALDPRVACVIGSDFGLPWRSTNWDAPWYFGSKVPSDDRGMAHHELLALLAPRPFFLIAGETDTSESWQYLHAARPVYDLYDAGHRLGCIDHASGHAPSIAALDVAYAWLGEHFKLPHRRWRA